MAKNFIHAGDTLELIAPAGGVVAGQGYVIGNRFVVALETKAATLTFVGAARGVWQLAKNATEATTAQQRAFWDDTAKAVRNASAAGRFVIGTCEGARFAADTYQNVVLDGIAVVAI